MIRVCIFRATNPNIYARFSYRSLHLNAMGAAIPHLMLLTTSLPSVLPFDSGEIRTQVLTGTVDVQDELIPDDEDEDISYRTRGKSTLSVVMTIGDGVDIAWRELKQSGEAERRACAFCERPAPDTDGFA